MLLQLDGQIHKLCGELDKKAALLPNTSKGISAQADIIVAWLGVQQGHREDHRV